MADTAPAHRLSKSRYLAGLQCHKQLWWRVHEPDAPELVPDVALRNRFAQGAEVDQRARGYVPGGELIDLPFYEYDNKVAATRDAIRHDPPVLYQPWRVVSDGVAGRRHLVVVLVERQVDQLAARDVTAGALVYFGALREAVAERHVGNELRRVGLMHPPPQLLVTLEAGEVAGLGEAVSEGRVGHEANLAANCGSSRAFTAVGRLHRLLMCPLPPSSRSSSSPRCS